MGEDGRNISTTMRLLKAVAGELRELAVDTARVGENLTEMSKIVGCDESIRMLQKFDMFTQSLDAHAVLIDALSGKLENGSLEHTELNELLHYVPFFTVRERLRAMVMGGEYNHKEEEGITEDVFF